MKSANPARHQQVQQFLTFRISRTHAKLNAQASHVLKHRNGLGLMQWRIIALLEMAGETTPNAISRTAGIDKGLLSRKLRTLIEDGLVTSRRDMTDQRQQLISLSEVGYAVFEETLPTMRKRQAYLLDLLTEEEETVLFAALDKLSVAAERREF